ncbi:MAG: uroporphyrinogen decarboxylase family protein [Rubrivivax sp.]
MTPRQRLQAALRGDVPDRVPASVWLHDFTQEHSAQALADASVHLARRFELDLLKPQMRAQCFGEMWGLEYQRSTRPDQWPLITRYSLASAADLAQIGTADAGRGALGEQVQAMRQVRAALGPEVPIVATVFSPMMNLTLMHRGGAPAVLALQREAPVELERALGHIGRTLEHFTRLCMDAGVDGIFYATKTINAGDATRAEWERFQRPFDEAILGTAAAAGAWANIVHICGESIQAEWFKDFAAPLVSWATTPGNPGLDEMRALFGHKTLLAGMPGKPAFAQMSPEALAAHVLASLERTGGVGHVLGPDCSINPGTPEPLIDAVFQAARAFKPKRVH